MLKSPLYFKKPEISIADGKLIIKEGNKSKEIELSSIKRIKIQSVFWYTILLALMFEIFRRKNITIYTELEEVAVNNLASSDVDNILKTIQQANQNVSIEKAPMLLTGTRINGIPIPIEDNVALPKWVVFLFLGVAILIFIVIFISAQGW